MKQSITCTVGLDIGDRFSHMYLLDKATGEIRQDKIATKMSQMDSFLASIAPARIVLEAGTHSRWISDLAVRHGHEVLVANPRKLRFIYASQNKCDQLDAEALARVGSMDPKLLHPIQHRSQKAHAARELLRTRETLVKMRTCAVNHVRGATKSMGMRISSCAAKCFAKKAKAELTPDILKLVLPLIEQIDALTESIKKCDRTIEKECEKNFPITERLMQIPGVGPHVSLAFVTTIDRPERFEKSRDVGPYLGLTPRRKQSGESDPRLGISKAGDVMMRCLLTNAAHYILGPFGPDTDLRRWGLAKSAAGTKKKAVAGVARRLAVLMHRLWTSGENYDRLRNAGRSQKGARCA